MNTSEINSLIDKFENSNIREISITRDNFSIYLSKNFREVTTDKYLYQNINNEEFDSNSIHSNNVNSINNKQVENDDLKVKTIDSPIVGKFYRAAAPDEKPFTIIGQKVKIGDVVGIVEAMKMMNEIKASEDGTIKGILVENGEMVEYGQPLISYIE